MKKFKIENAKIEQISGGPDIGIFVGEVELKPKSGKSVFLSITEADGCPMMFKTDHSVFDVLSDMGDEDGIVELQDNNLLYESDGYAELFENRDEIECFEGVRYLVYLVRASWDNMEAFIKATKGKYLDEVEVPKADVEKDWEEDDKSIFKSDK